MRRGVRARNAAWGEGKKCGVWRGQEMWHGVRTRNAARREMERNKKKNVTIIKCIFIYFLVLNLVLNLV
jgi:hypothetical protein